MTHVCVELAYEPDTLHLAIPAPNLIGVFAPRQLPPVADVAAEIERALAHPIGGLSLTELAHGAERVVLVADDNTRPTPLTVIAPILLDTLNRAGIPDAAIEIVIALGTHRQMTEAEIAQKFGTQVVKRVPVINHEAFDPSALVALGTTTGGVTVQVSRRVMKADLVLGIGSIVPHHIAGFSGGAKIIQPGVCGERTTGQVHLLSVRRERSLLGALENQVRAEMETIAERAGLRAILNTVLDSEGRVVGAVYGDPRLAFRQGVELSRHIYGVRVPRLADIVVADSHPCNIEFWQAHKTLYPAELCVRAGGTIIVVAPCPEGVSVTHPEIVVWAGRAPDEIEAAIHEGHINDLTAGALALAWANVRRRATISIVSRGIAAEEARALGFVPFATVEEALDDAFRRHGHNAMVSVLPCAPDTLPLLD